MVTARLEDYVLERVIGRGSMGRIHAARRKSDGARVAIKFLRASLADDRHLVVRFLNEARAASLLSHPGLVQTYGAGEDREGTPFIVMELLEGKSLRVLLRERGALPVQEVLRLGAQVAAAVAAAHEQRIVHRDLKPENILLVAEPEAEGLAVKVCDFGIAKLLPEHHAPGATVLQTQQGRPLGTPTYMAPEQCLAMSVSDRSDVYALGIILYECLAGRPPFLGGGHGEAALAELFGQHLRAEPPPIALFARDVPEPLQLLLERMLSKQPRARPSMAAVEASLERLRAPAPSSSPDGGAQDLPSAITPLYPLALDPRASASIPLHVEERIPSLRPSLPFAPLGITALLLLLLLLLFFVLLR
jgi:serine/threonine-protein kinase